MIQCKKHIDRYRSSLIFVLGAGLLVIVVWILYRYFLSSSVWRLDRITIDPDSQRCYPDPQLHLSIIQSLRWSNMWLLKLGLMPKTYTDLMQQYPLLWDISVYWDTTNYHISYQCKPPTMIWNLGKRTVGSWSGRMLEIQSDNPLLAGIMVWYLPDYITGTVLDSLYHVIPEHIIQKTMKLIQQLLNPIQQTYLVGSDKIQILTQDRKYVTLSMSYSITTQSQIITRLQKHYFAYRNLTHIDVSNLWHIVVKK